MKFPWKSCRRRTAALKSPADEVKCDPCQDDDGSCYPKKRNRSQRAPRLDGILERSTIKSGKIRIDEVTHRVCQKDASCDNGLHRLWCSRIRYVQHGSVEQHLARG